ncbi:tetraspanin-18B-like [Mytilus galloprovincialis]|uniref:tetraspanin-18B-like n=1 Tax=Mytilus galloprovincialis TaxID=29158 RepID=UPI003F7B80C5
MGCLMTIGRIFLIVTNIIFLVIGLVLLVVGLIAKFGESLFKSYYESIIASLEDSLSKAGYGDVTLDFSLSELAGSLPIALIVTGLILVIITVVAVIGAVKKAKCLLLIYSVVMFVIIAAQVLAMGMFYWKPEMITAPVKDSLNSTIQSDFAGLNGTNMVSIGWNFVNQKFKCCGIDNYYDFSEATNWVKNLSTGALLTPISCCKTLPSSGDLSCAQSALSASTNNYNTGCFDEIWDLAVGNVAITASIISVCLVMQIIFFLVALCMYSDNSQNKVKPKG